MLSFQELIQGPNLACLIVTLSLISILIIWQFAGYPLLTAYLALRSKNEVKDYAFQPPVSIIVPTFNEEKVIANRINNLFQLNYPKERYEVIIVDSGSKDSTVEIVRDIIDKNPIYDLTIVEEEKRKGKASAINYGKRFAKYDIVLVTDANSIFDKNVLREMAPYFKDPKVGAVGGRFVVLDPNNSITLASKFYWNVEYIMRQGESILDSACLFHGEINAWRKGIVDADARMLSEDLDMAVQIREKGYKIEYEPKAIVYELSPDTVRDYFIQRRRTSIGTIQVIFKYWNYFLFPKDWYGLIIFPSHKILPMLSPFLIIGIFSIYLMIWNINIIMIHLLISLVIFVFLFSCLTSSFKKKRFSFEDKNTIPDILKFVLINEVLILLAWKDFAFGRYSILWTKVDSTRN